MSLNSEKKGWFWLNVDDLKKGLANGTSTFSLSQVYKLISYFKQSNTS